MKKVLLSAIALTFAGALSAQNFVVTYNANLGTSTLGAGAASEVYWHAGAGELGPWEAVVGNWGMDDGIGAMTESTDDIWEITFDAATYFTDAGYAGPTPSPHIGMVFRNGDGTLEGKGYDDDADGNADDIFAVWNDATSSYDITCDCVTIVEEVVQSIDNIASVSDMNIAPNPFAANVTFSYTLDRTENVLISIFNMMGQEVATVVNDTQVAGPQVISWNSNNLPAGNYVYRMVVGNASTSGSIVKL
jgi:hypothetical protein